MTTPLRIFIGVDSREMVAYHVLADSILRRTTEPVSLIPLWRPALQRIHTRARGPTESTEFALTRFLVPYLSGYQGYSLFLDCDMLCRIDIGEVLLYPLADPGRAVYVCQHDYQPRPGRKFLDQPQTAYPRKNWTSFMIFDNARCEMLTPEFVQQATGLTLHRLQWLDDEQIGSLPLDLNWLVGEYPANPGARIWHWTRGGPWFDQYTHVDHAEEWFAARWVAMGAVQAAVTT